MDVCYMDNEWSLTYEEPDALLLYSIYIILDG